MTPGEHWYERYAWTLFLPMVAFALFEGTMGLLGFVMPDENSIAPMTGRTWEEIRAQEPGIASYVEMANGAYWVVYILWAVFWGAIAATAYRRGDRWAWWVMWAPLVGFTVLAAWRLARFGVNTFLFSIPFFALIGLGLLLPIRRFFRGTAETNPSPDPGLAIHRETP